MTNMVFLPLRSLGLLLVISVASHVHAQTLTWRAPDTVLPGESYTVSVACVDAATIVLIKDGVVVAKGSVSVAVTTADPVERSVTFTAYGYGGSVTGGAVSGTCSVEVVAAAQPQPEAVPSGASEAVVSPPALQSDGK